MYFYKIALVNEKDGQAILEQNLYPFLFSLKYITFILFIVYMFIGSQYKIVQIENTIKIIGYINRPQFNPLISSSSELEIIFIHLQIEFLQILNICLNLQYFHTKLLLRLQILFNQSDIFHDHFKKTQSVQWILSLLPTTSYVLDMLEALNL
ncbi:hypothetical protein pb186bvf_011755 [Paramecium bursaria]